ncbi:PEP-CTERM sorting domain-containing protein [Thalassomonas haliotis]|uniref:PEP-CTERM sorting domain-containing protein n=1 Tax=Thalassomonas haliotis TaxID=485448 RepID=A0ABY7VB54_9GAMM|nr:PEP-CTERM sorting domain-containing protein [Thalassomonas haliotis]WDE10536.1 PEP-CTERM sorting domain-containing protein [Thalassomonas haliotis]
MPVRQKHYLLTAAASCLFCTTSVNACLLTWDFTVAINTIYQDKANVIDDNIVVGTVLSGSFSYDDGLSEDSPDRDYVDRYADPNGSFTIAGLGIYDWSVSAFVVHQDSRDIVDVKGDYWSGNIYESVEIGFYDHSQSYDNGVLPVNWHNPPLPFAEIEFDYTLSLGTDPCCYDSRLSGYVSSIALHAPTDVPAPSTMLLLALGLFALSRKAKRS